MVNLQSIHRVIQLGSGSLYRSTWDGKASDAGVSIACRHCKGKKVWDSKYIWALRHIEKQHGVDWVAIAAKKATKQLEEWEQEVKDAEFA